MKLRDRIPRVFFLYASVFFALLTVTRHAFAVGWETQAERLQLVSAAMLDAEPMLTPIDSKWHLGLRSVVSILPKTNATVGGKTEQPPQPPVHSVPTLELGGKYDVASAGAVHARVWAGYLPESAAKTTGMNAAAKQSIWGAALGYDADRLSDVIIRTDIGSQSAVGHVEGAMTEADASDRFDVSSRIDFASVTVSAQRLKTLWLQLQVAQRRVQSRFDIPKDDTSLEFSDESRVADGNASSQIAAGFGFQNGISVAAGYLNVPGRLSMPRFLLGYNVPVGMLMPSSVAKNDTNKSDLYADRRNP